MRLLSASEINLITICKCYSCFYNRPSLTLEACIYIHTHEPKTKLNADTGDQHMLKARYTTHFVNHIKLCDNVDLNSLLKTSIYCPVACLVGAIFSVITFLCKICVLLLKEHTPDTRLLSCSRLTSNSLYPVKGIMYANPPGVNRNSVQCI